MEDKIKILESILRKNIQGDKNTKIHRLVSEKDNILIVSRRGQNNSYSFYTPQFTESTEMTPKIVLVPIKNIFDFLEDNQVISELSETENEETHAHGRNK